MFHFFFIIPSFLSQSLLCLYTPGWIRGKDPSRLVHYEGGGSRTPSTDIVCPMYMRVWDMVKIANDPDETRPLILCEYEFDISNFPFFFVFRSR